MLINANSLVQIQTETVKAESDKLVVSQGGLRTYNSKVVTTHDGMVTYLRDEIATAYQEIGEYVQAKMELLCGVVEGTANNSASFAKNAEEVDATAAEKVQEGDMNV